jgi:hypothetical protein
MGPSNLLTYVADSLEWAHLHAQGMLPIAFNGPTISTGSAADGVEWAYLYAQGMLPMALNGPTISTKLGRP